MAKRKTKAEIDTEADAKAAEKKAKADAKDKPRGHYVAKGKAVFCNAKGCLGPGMLVKPEWFDNKKDFEKWIKTGHIIKV